MAPCASSTLNGKGRNALIWLLNTVVTQNKEIPPYLTLNRQTCKGTSNIPCYFCIWFRPNSPLFFSKKDCDLFEVTTVIISTLMPKWWYILLFECIFSVQRNKRNWAQSFGWSSDETGQFCLWSYYAFLECRKCHFWHGGWYKGPVPLIFLYQNSTISWNQNRKPCN